MRENTNQQTKTSGVTGLLLLGMAAAAITVTPGVSAAECDTEVNLPESDLFVLAEDPCKNLECASDASSDAECKPTTAPSATAIAYIGVGHGTGHVCTGTQAEIATGTASATFGGGAIIKAEVTVGLAVALLYKWDFACDYAMFAGGFGSDGVVREVRTQRWEPSAQQYVDVTFPCTYDGIMVVGCGNANTVVLADAYSGNGIAGPGGWRIPTEVKVCPPTSHITVKTINEGVVGGTAQDITGFTCQSFGIHYR